MGLYETLGRQCLLLEQLPKAEVRRMYVGHDSSLSCLKLSGFLRINVEPYHFSWRENKLFRRPFHTPSTVVLLEHLVESRE